jgi:disulfide bond formation protein DsbB
LAYPRSQFHHRRAAGLDPRDLPWLVTALAFAALCVAWIAQYGFGLAPCELCYWTRYAYWGVIVIGLIATFFGRRPKARKFWLNILGLALLVVVGVSVFQVGVEHGWWRGTDACVGASTAGMTVDQETAAIMNAPVVRCDQPAFVLLGISMAGYNIIYALIVAWIAFWGASRRSYR